MLNSESDLEAFPGPAQVFLNKAGPSQTSRMETSPISFFWLSEDLLRCLSDHVCAFPFSYGRVADLPSPPIGRRQLWHRRAIRRSPAPTTCREIQPLSALPSQQNVSACLHPSPVPPHHSHRSPAWSHVLLSSHDAVLSREPPRRPYPDLDARFLRRVRGLAPRKRLSSTAMLTLAAEIPLAWGTTGSLHCCCSRRLL